MNSSKSRSSASVWPLLLTFVRLPLIFAASLLIFGLLRQLNPQLPFNIAPLWAVASVTLANLVCLWWLNGRSQKEDVFRPRALIDFQLRRLGPDCLQGFLWSFLLFGLLLIGYGGTIFSASLLTGQSFEALTLGSVDFSLELPGWFTPLLTFVSAVFFPLLNPLIEELQFRGYAQPRLMTAFGRWPGLLLVAFGFAIQHALFAFTLLAALAYTLGFFLWGLGAGLIFERQGRLMPLLIAHLISNLSFAFVPLFFLLSSPS